MLTEQKTRLREHLKQKRRSLTREQRLEFDQAIYARLLEQVELGQVGSVFCYVSAGTEVNTHPLIDRLRQLGKTVVIPRIVSSEKMIAVPFDNWGELRVGQLGILTPDKYAEWQSGVDLCITPGLGFTPDGKRIGFGRGYYDKWFADHPHVARTALCYECQIVDAVPVTETDMTVDQIITEKRLISC